MNQFLRAFLALVLLLPVSSAWAVVYKFTNIADTTTSAPVGTFMGFNPPAISGSTVAFSASYSGGYGIFTSSGGSFSTIVNLGDPGPAGPFAFLGKPAISDNNVAFYGGFGDVLQTSGIFVGSGGPLTTIVLERDPAPEGTFDLFNDPSISGTTVAFSAAYRNPPLDHASGIFTGSGGSLTTIVNEGDPAPSGTFFNFVDPAISGSKVAFWAAFGEGETGIFAIDSGLVTTIAKLGDATPIGTFTGFASPSIGGDAVAFFGFGDNGEGIFTGSGGPVTSIVKTGDPAPSDTFVAFHNMSFDGTTVAFLGEFGDLTIGPSDSAIFTMTSGVMTRVLGHGDSLFGSSVVSFEFDRFGLDPDGSGNLAFHYVLADGRRGVALASIVPEPGTLLIFGAMAVTILLRARFRFRRSAV